MASTNDSSTRRTKKKSSGVPPPTDYRDDPSNSYRDIPTQDDDDDEENLPSVFDWGGDDSAKQDDGSGGNNNRRSNSAYTQSANNNSNSFDPQVEIPFTPISLHDEDDTDSEVSGSNTLRPHNGLLSKVVSRRSRGHAYNPVGSGEEEEEEEDNNNQGRLFVGGGWGRHGSSMDWCSCPRRFCFGGSGGLLCSSTGCILMVFLTLTVLSGYLGYEAGLPVTVNTTLDDDTDTDTTLGVVPSITNDDDDDGFETTQHATTTTTHGDLWLEWIKNEKNQHLHLPHLHLNFTRRHSPIITTDSQNQLQLSFPPMTQSDLLEHSEHLFQSCSERSIATKVGREACLSLCHGHYCCFEKDVEFGSCVATPNSYCFVYAACENVILDFGFTNINLGDDDEDGEDGPHKKKEEDMGSVDVDGLNREDLELLDQTCSKENVATLEGIRDCNAFCQHHLCCFSEDEEENCKEDHGDECEAYESCRVIADGPEEGNKNGGGGESGGGGSSITVSPEEVEKAVFSACYFGSDESKVTEELVTQCHSICSSRYCCFESQSIVSSCRDTVGEEECEMYSLCEQMINDRGEEVKNFIELDELEFGTGGSSSSSSGTSYRPGSSNGVFVDEGEFEATVNEVKAVCTPDQSGDESWVAECHATCADYLCCFATDGTGSNCKDVHGEDVCEAYYGCKVLQSSSSSSSSASKVPISSGQQQQSSEQVQIDEVNEVCVPKIRRDASLRARCEKVCASRDCCWQSGPGNCYVMNTEWCDEYAMCEILDL